MLPGLLVAQDESLRLSTTLDGYVAEAPDTRTTIEEVGPRQDDGTLLLSLEQVITLSLRRNLTLAVERYSRSRSILGIQQNRGIYDLQLTSTLSTQNENSEPSSTLEDATILVQDTTRADLSLSQLTPLGGTLRFDYLNSEFESTNQRVDPNPQFEIDLDFTITQPLLRNFGRTVTERNLVVARNNVSISREDFQARVEDILQQVIDGYWNLVEAREQLKVAQESLTLAKDLDRMNRIQVEVGTLAALEVIQSEAGVAARKEAIITLGAQVDDAADALRSLINLETTDVWDLEIVPVTDPETETRSEVDVHQAVATAFENRPDMRRRRLLNETLGLDSRVARNAKLPRVDLSTSYGFNALDGERRILDANNDPIIDEATGLPIRTDDGYSEAFAQITDGEFVGWTVRVQVGYPIQNRDARARSADADLSLEQGELQLRELELRVRTDVRSAARALRAAAQRVETAKASSELARRSLEAEQKRYENGLATSFGMLQFQEDLSEARSREVSAIVSYRRAETRYYRSIGGLLERFHVVLADDE